jgi:hypothetical protein
VKLARAVVHPVSVLLILEAWWGVFLCQLRPGRVAWPLL